MKKRHSFKLYMLRNVNNPNSKHNRNPLFRKSFSRLFFFPIDSDTKGVNAVENPIPIDIAIRMKLLPKDTAASSLVPSLPTIILSINWTIVCPKSPRVTG